MKRNYFLKTDLNQSFLYVKTFTTGLTRRGIKNKVNEKKLEKLFFLIKKDVKKYVKKS